MKKFAALLFALYVLCIPAFAAEAPSAADVQELSKLLQSQKQLLEKQQQQIEQQQKALEEQQRKFEVLQQQITALSNSTPTPAEPPVAVNAFGEQTQPRPSEFKTAQAFKEESGNPPPAEVGTERKPVDEEKPPEIAAELEEGGVLLQKGKLVLTPGMEYTRSSATKVAIEGFGIVPAVNIGLFQISKVGRDVLTASYAARLGITNRIEIEGKIPYVYRRDSTTGRPIGGGASTDSTTSVSGDGLGDVEVGAHYQINKGKEGWPFFIGNLRFKSNTGTGTFEVPTNPSTGLQTELPTGSGFMAIQPSVTAIYPSDPVVYYMNVGYLHNFSEDYGGTIGEIEPGDSISGSFGMSMSLNDRASFSLGYTHNTVLRTRQNGDLVAGSELLQVGTLDLGYAYQLTDRYNINFNINAGLTDDAPDARLSVRVPIKFDLF